MAVNARTEEFQHIEVFDKPALFTNGRIARDTVPKGWYCYDIRGSDDDPGELCYMEENVVVNHAGSVLMPEKLAMPKSGRLDVRDELGFLDEGSMTLREFCEAHQLPYPAENMKFHIRPARPEEAGLFYTPHPEEDTMSARYGTGGNNVPLVEQEETFCITGNAIDRQPQNGGNGIGYQRDIAYTLTATDHLSGYPDK